MPFSPELAEIRFGCGLSPVIPAPIDPAGMLKGLIGPDDMARRFAIDDFGLLRARLVKVGAVRKRFNASKITRAERDKQLKALRRNTGKEGATWFGQSMQRWINTRYGFHERLVAFWADHFTAMGKNAFLKFAAAPYIEEAIRPNISGQFGDLLIAATTHPVMLRYLDQSKSVGPASQAAARSKRLKGLNENLAREVMELHTLGVGGPYTQDDVRQLAELFTGLSLSPGVEFRFRANYAEPGPETILGQTYGGDPATLEPVLQSLRDLAAHPATARHIARKLAVHFVSDAPDPGLVQHIEGRFIDTGGNLLAICGAMLEHPSSWNATLSNVKPPADFVASSCRALAPDPARFEKLGNRAVKRLLMDPLALMGQPWQRPNGPDGWTEDDGAWITPQGVSARLRWALSVPQKLRPGLLDPRKFVTAALGSIAPPEVLFAASAAEIKSDAIGLVLASPAFQRR